MVLEGDKGRIPELLPFRHGRMALSPFTFYRGSALNMAVDLASTPATRVRVQCCGDAHLGNFRGLGTPERRVIFAINDLDETLPAPWEWDLKRLAASFVVACRNNNLSESTARDAVLTCVRSYREHMSEFSDMNPLDLWYCTVDSQMLLATLDDAEFRKRAIKRIEKEQTRRVEEDLFPTFKKAAGKTPVIEDQLPTIFHWKGHKPGEIHSDRQEVLRPLSREPARHPLERCSTATNSGTPRSRWSGSAASALVAGWLCSRTAMGILSFSRARRHAPRCWRRMPARVCSPTTDSVS